MADELAKIRDEYIKNPIRQYQPKDPWFRSNLFRLQTGHYGRFYNCDKEECKRFSPYICWKNSSCPTIPKKPCLQCVREELNKVRRRVCDGAGPCCNGGSECNCAKCVPTDRQYGRSAEVSQHQQVAESSVHPTRKGDGTMIDGTMIQGNIFEPPVRTANLKNQQPCDCEKCRANKRANNIPAVKPSRGGVASSELLNRVRSIQQKSSVQPTERTAQNTNQNDGNVPWRSK